MIKMVGKKLFVYSLLCLFSSLYLNARISMEIRTENGTKNEVVVGQPFTLEVIIDDVYGSIAVPTIKGLEGCASRLTGTYMSNINGKSSARYSYTVRIDKLGVYNLGPAITHHKQQELISNQLQVSVVTDPGIVVQKNKNNAASKAFLRLMVDTETPFVGQKMSCCLRFYYQDTSLSLHNVGIPELSGFDIKEISKLESGTAEIDGVSYYYAQWRWDMYPTKPGDFIIPAYHADYDIPLHENNHLLSGFFMFMGNRIDRKRVYSNALTVKVLPLPHYDGQVHAVGSFESITAHINPGIAKEGEGMVLTIELEGIGNLSEIKMPPLHMPESLKYYDSHSSVVMSEHIDELPKKKFEFIVQAMKAGSYEIPEQLFTYFDIEKKMYVTLRTSSLALCIKPGATPSKKDSISDAIAECSIYKEDQIAPIRENDPWYPIDEHMPLPWWLFHMLFFFPCIYIGYPAFIQRYVLLVYNWIGLRRRHLINQTRKKIEYCRETHNSKDMHSIFVDFVKQCSGTITIYSVKDFLKKQQVSQELIEEWDVFFERIVHAAYAQDNHNTDELCRMAQQWLDYLAKNL